LETSEFTLTGNVNSGGIEGKIEADTFKMKGQLFSSFNGTMCTANEFKNDIENTLELQFVDDGIVANIPQLRFPETVDSKIVTTNTGIPIKVASVTLIGGEVSMATIQHIPLKFVGNRQYEFDVKKYVRVTTHRTDVEILPLIGSRFDASLNGQSTDKTSVYAFVDTRRDDEVTLKIQSFLLDVSSTIRLEGSAVLKASSFKNCTQTCQLHGVCLPSKCMCECGWSGNECEVQPKVEYKSVDYVLPNRVPNTGGSVITALFSPPQSGNKLNSSLLLPPPLNFESGINGWSCGAITACGTFGKICGGYGQKGKNADIKKRFDGLTIGETYVMELDFIKIDSWDDEYVHVLFDGVECWSNKFKVEGANQCGNTRWGDTIHKVKCSGMAKKTYIDIRIWADLNEGLLNEAFGIDNIQFNSQKVIQNAIAEQFGVIIVGHDVCTNVTVISDSAVECTAPKASLDKDNYVAKVYRAATKDVYCHLPHLSENDQNGISSIFYYESEEVQNICGTCSNGEKPKFLSTTESVVASNNLNGLAKKCFVDHCREDTIIKSFKRDVNSFCACPCLPGWSGYDCGKCMRKGNDYDVSNTSSPSSSPASATFGCSNLQNEGTNSSSNGNDGKKQYVCDTNIAYEPDSDIMYYCNPNPELKELTGDFDVKMSCGLSGVGECSMNVWVPSPRGAFRFLGCQVYGCGVKSVTSTDSKDKIKQTITCRKAKCSCAKDAPCTPYIESILESVTGPFDFACTTSTGIMGNTDFANCEVNEDNLPLKILLDCNAGVCRDKMLKYQDPEPRRVINVQLVLAIVLIVLLLWIGCLVFFPKLKNTVVKRCTLNSNVVPNDNSSEIYNAFEDGLNTNTLSEEVKNTTDANPSNLAGQHEERQGTLKLSENFSLPNVVRLRNNEKQIDSNDGDDILTNVFSSQHLGQEQKLQNHGGHRNMYFENIRYVVHKTMNGSTQRLNILKGIGGVIENGKLTGMLGLSGAGKTSLLKILGAAGGRSSLPPGARGHFIGFPAKCLYVSQESVIMDSLTVEEQIYFSAMLRQPPHLSYRRKMETVNLVIKQLNLTHVKGSYGKVLSGGEKRRLAIGLELVAVDLTTPNNNNNNNNNPDNSNRLFILDEPLSGLDSIIALHLVRCLSSIAKRYNLSIVMSVHQPSNEMYDLLDNIMFIHSGKMAYHGPASNALKEMPNNTLRGAYQAGRCPADILLQNGDAISNQNDGKGVVASSSYWSNFGNEKIKAEKFYEKMTSRRQNKVSAKFCKQIWYLGWRSTLNITREPELLRYHLTIALCSALFLGTVFFSVTDDLAGFQNRAGVSLICIQCDGNNFKR
jgi:ABC-type multidrug transport system ATPase subunit